MTKKKLTSRHKTDRIHGWQDNYNDYIIRRHVSSATIDENQTHVNAHSRLIVKDINKTSGSITTSPKRFSANIRKEGQELMLDDENQGMQLTKFNHVINDCFDRIKLKPVQALKLNIHEATRTRLCRAIEKKLKEQEELKL